MEQLSKTVIVNKNHKILSNDISELKGLFKAYTIMQENNHNDNCSDLINEIEYRLECLDDDIKVICRKYKVKKRYNEVVDI